MRRDLVIRLAPFALVCALVQVALHPPWMGWSTGDLPVQLAFGCIGAPVLFVAATFVQWRLTRARGRLSVPRGPSDAWFQAAYYALNAPIEEAHISCSLVHLANVSYRLGRSLRFDPETAQVIGDEEANHLLCEKDRGYRAPFVVPDQV